MKISSYHLHSTFCDGKNTAEEMILAAIENGCAEIGFSGHSHLPGEEWTMSEEGVVEYFNTLTSLREKYKDKIRVYIGIEQDFYSAPPTLPFDYIIGSVHFVRAGGKSYSVDESVEATLRAINEGFGGDAYAYCESYYDNVAKLYEKTKCDIIGHFDLVTKFIEKAHIFSENHPRYKAARDKALEALFATPALFEINTGAISRGYRTTPYPSNEIIEKIAETGKPFVLNSDAHSAEDILFGLEPLVRNFDFLGYHYIKSLSEVLSITRK